MPIPSIYLNAAIYLDSTKNHLNMQLAVPWWCSYLFLGNNLARAGQKQPIQNNTNDQTNGIPDINKKTNATSQQISIVLINTVSASPSLYWFNSRARCSACCFFFKSFAGLNLCPHLRHVTSISRLPIVPARIPIPPATTAPARALPPLNPFLSICKFVDLHLGQCNKSSF